MVCAHCRAENPEDNTYCGKCGHTLASEASPPRYADRASLVRREIAVVAAGIGLLLAAAFGAWFAIFAQRSPEAVVRRFIEADRSGDLERQAQYVSARIDSRLILSAVQTFRQQAGVSLFDRHRILGSVVGDHTATVNVEITLNTPLPAPLRGAPPGVAVAPRNNTMVVGIELIREDNEWKIDPTKTLASVTGVLLANGYQSLQPGLPGLPNAWPPPGIPGPFGLPAPSSPAPAPGGTL